MGRKGTAAGHSVQCLYSGVSTPSRAVAKEALAARVHSLYLSARRARPHTEHTRGLCRPERLLRARGPSDPHAAGAFDKDVRCRGQLRRAGT